MADQALCSIEGCGKPAKCRGWCARHYGRWQRLGDPLAGRAAQGEPRRWLEKISNSPEVEHCILWPFAVGSAGYGVFVEGGKHVYAHRTVCEMEHGPQPPGDNHAAHRCGNRLCVNRKHLRWASRSENEQDKIGHGLSNRGERCGSAILTECDVREVRALLAKGVTQRHVAEMFGVTEGAVNSINRRQSWAWLE